MSPTNKYRMWWLSLGEDEDFIWYEPVETNLNVEIVPVIEHSAYKKVCSDFERTIGIAHGALEAGHVESALRVLSNALDRITNDQR